MERKTSLFFCVVICLLSCSGKLTKNRIPVYDNDKYQQFWTADWSPDNKLIAVGGVDSLLRIYHANNLKLYQSYQLNTWIHAVKWHPDGQTLAVATLDNYVQLLNIKSGNITQLSAKGGSRTIDWNYNGELLAVGDLDGVVKMWSREGNLVKTIKKNYGPDVVGKSYLGVDWHPHKNILVAANFQINLFDSTGNEIKTMEHTNKEAIILCVNWHPSGEFFVIGDYGHNWEGENVPSLLHFWTPDGIKLRSVPGSKAEYRNISWNKAGTRLATASDVLRLWTKDGTLLHASEPDSTNYLWGISWNANDDKIVTASRHKTIAIWDTAAKLIRKVDVGGVR